MRTLTKLVPLAFIGAATVQACGDLKYADPGNTLVPKGVIRGTVTYNGPAPCSQNGHIVGNAIILVFDRKNPPPPAGLGNTAVNFVAVPGDTLFRDWPRTPDDVKRCPSSTQQLTVSAGFTIAPMDAGSYVLQSFYDYTGNFLPTFKVRQLPEATDVGGGYIDINDATSIESTNEIIGQTSGGDAIYAQIPKQADPNYQPVFLPVNIGTPGAVPFGSLRGVPDYTMPPEGFLADNVAITIGAKLPLARPYFYPEGVVLPTIGSTGQPVPQLSDQIKLYGDSSTLPSPGVPTPANPDGNPAYQPILTFPSNLPAYAQPTLSIVTQHPKQAPDIVNEYQAGFPQLKLHFGVPSAERAVASSTSIADPFHMQLGPDTGGNGGIFVWWDGNHHDQALDYIPESPGTVPKMWPLVVLAKLIDDPDHTKDPQGLIAQGSDLKSPAVIIQGITLGGDALFQMIFNKATCIDDDNTGACSKATLPVPSDRVHVTDIVTKPTTANLQEHVTVLLRPSAVCFDPQHIDLGGLLVTPHFTGPFPPSDTFESGEGATVNRSSVLSNPQVTSIVRDIQEKCIPPGRYGINLVYPTGQAWSVPNEAGHCAILEGDTVLQQNGAPGNCSLKSRPVLTSQGMRAYVEVTPDTTGYCTGDHAVPPACLAPGEQ